MGARRARSCLSALRIGAPAASALLAALLSAALPVAPPLALLSAARLQQRRRYLHRAREVALDGIETRFCTLIALSGLLWGGGALLLMHDVPFEYQFLVVAVLAGAMAAMTVAVQWPLQK